MSDAWTYGGDLADNPLDLVRYLIGDTTKTRHSPTDTEVEYWIGIHTVDGVTDAHKAAAEVARHLSRRFRRLSSTTQVKIGDMSLHTNYAALADQMDDIASTLDGGGDAATDVGGPLWGDNGKAGSFALGFMDNT